ncbi:MAG: T9SS type A sorting domain-containing protein [Bacteroidetes bacterium]|nr:T9SS type A sorting domain-containing protein [Bacteroidota bacterium]
MIVLREIKVLRNIENGTQSIDVSSLANGVYFVTLTAGEMIERKKIIIEK